jgi:hypothetical protein
MAASSRAQRLDHSRFASPDAQAPQSLFWQGFEQAFAVDPDDPDPVLGLLPPDIEPEQATEVIEIAGETIRLQLICAFLSFLLVVAVIAIFEAAF